MDKVVLLLNPSSGRGRSLREKEKIIGCFKKNKINFDLLVSESEKDLKRLAKNSIHKYPFLVGVGGDTTFNIIASEILESEHSAPVLGMIGTGSANDIVTALGIKETEFLCQAIRENKIKKMDVGCIKIDNKWSSHFFLGTLSSGLGTLVNQYVQNFCQNHKLISRLLFFNQLVPGFLGTRHSFSKKKVPIKVFLEYNNCKREVDFSLLVFLNTPYYANGLKLSPEATPFDGLLDCCIVNTTSFLNTISIRSKIQKGNHLKREEVDIIQSNSFKIFSEQELDFQKDGEIIAGLKEFEVSIYPRSLNIFTP